MIQTTSSNGRQPEQTVRFSENELNIPVVITCTICGAGYGPSLAHQSLLQAPPTVLEAAFMSVCHFCFRCRRPACPACWDSVHGVCGACVQEADLPFRVDTAPLRGVIFPPVREEHTLQENSASPLLVCVRPGRFRADVSHSTDLLKALPVVAAPAQYGLQEGIEERGRTTGRLPGIAPVSQDQDDYVYELQRPRVAVRIIKVVERIVTVILLFLLLAIAVMVVVAEVSGTGNSEIVRLVHVDIRYEIAYLVSLVRQLHF